MPAKCPEQDAMASLISRSLGALRRLQSSLPPGTAATTPTGHSSYNSLQTALDRRFSKGVSLQASYTWSKAMGICCNDNSDGGPQIQALQFYSLNRSLMSFDRTHNFELTGIVELPFGRGKRLLSDGVGA